MESDRSFHLDKKWFIDSKHGNIKDEFKFIKKLGWGGYGTVYMAERKSTGERVAIKAIQKTRIKEYEDFLNEMSILKGLVSP